MIAPLSRLMDFDGRSTRAEHWPYMGLLIALYLLGTMVAIMAVPHWVMMATIALLSSTLVLLAAASVVRRLHDVGWSGWWMAAYSVLFIGFVAFFLYSRYGVVRQPDGVGPPPLIFRFWPIVMTFNFAMQALALLLLILTALESVPRDNKYGSGRPSGSTR